MLASGIAANTGGELASITTTVKERESLRGPDLSGLSVTWTVTAKLPPPASSPGVHEISLVAGSILMPAGADVSA